MVNREREELIEKLLREKKFPKKTKKDFLCH